MLKEGVELDRDSLPDGTDVSSEEIVEVLKELRQRLQERERVLNFDDDHLLDDDDYVRLTGNKQIHKQNKQIHVYWSV